MFLKRRKIKELKLLLSAIPFRVIIDNILIYIEFLIELELNVLNFYGHFELDRSHNLFWIWKSCGIFRLNNFNNVKNVNLKNLTLSGCCNFIGDCLTPIKSLSIFGINKFIGDKLIYSIKTLEVHFCNFFIGDNLPINLELLSVWKCPLFVGDKLPKSLKNFIISSGSELFFGNNLPINLKKLNVGHCIKFFGQDLPKGLKYLYVYKCRNFITDNLPKSLKHVDILN